MRTRKSLCLFLVSSKAKEREPFRFLLTPTFIMTVDAKSELISVARCAETWSSVRNCWLSILESLTGCIVIASPILATLLFDDSCSEMKNCGLNRLHQHWYSRFFGIFWWSSDHKRFRCFSIFLVFIRLQIQASTQITSFVVLHFNSKT